MFGYSLSLKRKLLSGNILISLLTAWVILIITSSEAFYLYNTAADSLVLEAHRKIIRIGNLYAGFAFISSLIREAIKDMEDMDGDAKYGCRTMPIVWGVNTSKAYVAVWLVVLIAILVIVVSVLGSAMRCFCSQGHPPQSLPPMKKVRTVQGLD